MRTVEEKLQSLNAKSVWYFAKQDTSFDNAFKAVKMFDEIHDRSNVNIEDYFIENKARYDLDCNHRILSVAQLFGLLSKSNPFERGSRYNTETPTPVFNYLKRYRIGSPEYNAIKTEQLLKLRMCAITDSRAGSGEYKIGPILFAFEVFWKLHLKGIDSITVPQFYTYVMTCKTHDELDEAVELLSQNPRPSQYVSDYIDSSRVLSIIQNNFKLLTITGDRIQITPQFVSYFSAFFNGPYTALVRTFDIIMETPDTYIKVLTNYIGLGLNFINAPINVVSTPNITPTPTFTPDITPIMKNFITALRTKPFLLLAGISGTGKSQKVKELAYMTCQKGTELAQEPTSPGNYCLIEVKPNWHDSSELLGYYSNLSGKYTITPFMHFIYKATKNPEVPFFVCLDEMNLAPVEQYFAEYLSVLETRILNNGNIESAALLKKEIFESCAEEKNGESLYPDSEIEILRYLKENGLRLPENLFVIGTVNMDDTTHQFSRKVIDRAFTIEMNGDDLSTMFNNVDPLVYPDECTPLSSFKPNYVKASDALEDPVIADYKDLIVSEIPARLKEINNALENTPFKVSFRVQNELVLYLSTLIIECKPTDEREVLKLIKESTLIILLEKILPRVQGDHKLLGDSLKNLRNLVVNEYSSEADSPVYVEVESKLTQMQHQLDNSYFANFF